MRLGARVSIGGLRRFWVKPDRRRGGLLAFLAALAIIAIVWSLRGYIADIDAETLGYPGVFLLSLLGSVSMVLPIPGLISVCSVSVLLNPFLVGVMAGIGETLGEISGYGVGYGGGTVVERHRMYTRIKGWMERRGTLVIFVVSVIPNPVFDVVGIAAGATRFPLHRFLGIVLVGKLLKGIMVAYTCDYGLTHLPWVD